MKVKSFRASSISEALSMVKRELGSEAVILRTRRLNRVGPGIGGGVPRFEVTASVEDTPTFSHSPRVMKGEKGQTLRMELVELRRAFEALARQVKSRSVSAWQGELGELADKLVAGGIDESIIDQAIHEVNSRGGGLSGEDLSKTILSHITGRVSLAGGLSLKNNGPKVVALVGPTGVGKTTTIAKLASIFSVIRRRRVALVSCDTYRIGAVEQLKTFADIVSLPVSVVLSPGDMQAAIKKYAGYDLVLIDTPGRSPNDRKHLQELSVLMSAANPDEIHLILSAGTRYQDLLDILEKFQLIPITHLLFSKIDETSRYGDMISLAIHTSKSISYLTTGQNVPDDITTPRPESLCRMLLTGTYDG